MGAGHRGNPQFSGLSNPFFPEQRSPRRSFPKDHFDLNERGMRRRGKERGQGSSKWKKPIEHRFMDDLEDEEFNKY